MYIRTIPGVLMGGILPFGCIFIQLFFILNSIWLAKYTFICHRGRQMNMKKKRETVYKQTD